MALAATDGKGVRHRQRIATRDRLFKAAMSEFRRVGYAHAKIQRIADLAGTSVGSFYFHFPDKEDVLIEQVERAARDMAHQLRDATKPRSVRGFLLRVVDWLVRDELQVGGALFRDIMAAIARNRANRDWIGELYAADLTQFLRERQAAGEVRPDLTPEVLNRVFFTSVAGYLTEPPRRLRG